MKTRRADQTIETPQGLTYYQPGQFAVYEHSVYPRGSVLAGQARRVWLDSFDTLVEAQQAFPDAVLISGTSFDPMAGNTSPAPPHNFDPDYAGERWDENY